MIIASEANIYGFFIKTYPKPPTITELEADLYSNGWVRGFLIGSRQGYRLFGLRYGGGGGADLQLHIRPMDWLPHNSASPYRKTYIYAVRKFRAVAEELEDGDVLLINDLNDDEAFIISQSPLPPLATTDGWERLSLLFAPHTHTPTLTP